MNTDPLSEQQMDAMVKSESARWAEVIKAARIEAD